MLSLQRLTLTDFRNYANLVWHPACRISVLNGPNGCGKTNLLEGLSLLVPGRGMRAARLGDLARRDPVQAAAPHAASKAAYWAVAARLAHSGEGFELGTGTAPDTPAGRRAFRLDGRTVRQAAVASALAAVWLTPQMDRLFVEASSGRRRFLDRLVLALEPGHAREVAAHDQALAGRNRLLQGGADQAWLDALEHALARHAVAVTAARRALVTRMNRVATAPLATPSFPPAQLELECPIGDRLQQHPALAVEDWLREALREARRQDFTRSSVALGAHRADLQLRDLASGQPASLGSTGQQKALLIGVLLSHAALIAEVRGEAPLLLLDEPLVHLDGAHRAALFAALAQVQAPVLLTGTDAEPFAALVRDAEFLVPRGGKLESGR